MDLVDRVFGIIDSESFLTELDQKFGRGTLNWIMLFVTVRLYRWWKVEVIDTCLILIKK